MRTTNVMSNKTNDLILEDARFDFDEAILLGDLARAQAVIDRLKEAGLPTGSLIEEIEIEKAHNEDLI